MYFHIVVPIIPHGWVMGLSVVFGLFNNLKNLEFNNSVLTSFTYSLNEPLKVKSEMLSNFSNNMHNILGGPHSPTLPYLGRDWSP